MPADGALSPPATQLATALVGGIDETFPLNTAVEVTSTELAASLAGEGGTLRRALEGIGDQANPIVIGGLRSELLSAER